MEEAKPKGLPGVVGQQHVRETLAEMESSARVGNSPVRERVRRLAGTRVPQDTRNPVGSRETTSQA